MPQSSTQRALQALFSGLAGTARGIPGFVANQDQQNLLAEALTRTNQRQDQSDARADTRVNISQGNLDFRTNKFATEQRQGNNQRESNLLASMLSTEGSQLFKNALSRGDFGSATRLSPTIGGAQFSAGRQFPAARQFKEPTPKRPPNVISDLETSVQKRRTEFTDILGQADTEKLRGVRESEFDRMASFLPHLMSRNPDAFGTNVGGVTDSLRQLFLPQSNVPVPPPNDGSMSEAEYAEFVRNWPSIYQNQQGGAR